MSVENKQTFLDDKYQELMPEFESLKAGQTTAISQCQATEARCSEVRMVNCAFRFVCIL